MLGLLRAYLITDPLAILYMLAFGAHGVIASWLDRSGARLHPIGRFWGRALLRMAGVKVYVRGLEKVSSQGAYIYVANHLSFADTPLVFGYLPTPFRFLAKHTLFKAPIIGSHLRRGGHIPVIREDARSALRSLVQAARLVREQGLSMVVFAEGSRSDGSLQAFKTGAAHLAIHTGVPVVPLALAGTPGVMPRGSLTIRPGRVELRIGDPIPTAGLTSRDRDRLTELVHNRVAALLDGRPQDGR